MNTGRLYEFMVLGKLLNFSQAAKALYITQSVLSRHMQDLEKETGVSLLNRTTHGVTLTEAGKILLNQSPDLLNQAESVVRRLRDQNMPAKGSVRIGMGLEFSYSNSIRTFIKTFLTRYPDIDFHYDVYSINTPMETVLQYDLFFTPCAYHALPPDTRQILSRKHGTLVVLPANHALISRTAISLPQLYGQTLIVPYAQELFGPYAQNWMLIDKATHGHISVIKVDNLSTALFLVSMGKGICVASRYIKNMLPVETTSVSISGTHCCFNEYLYYNEKGNGIAKLFFEEFQNGRLSN